MSEQKLVTMKRKSRQSRQKLSTLTIHEISPMWASLLARLPETSEQRFYNKEQLLDITDCKFCVVGEAYGFKDDYREQGNKDFCWDCHSSSMNFANCLEFNGEVRKELVDEFVSHWNQTHI